MYEEKRQATEPDHEIIEWKWSKTAPGLMLHPNHHLSPGDQWHPIDRGLRVRRTAGT